MRTFWNAVYANFPRRPLTRNTNVALLRALRPSAAYSACLFPDHCYKGVATYYLSPYNSSQPQMYPLWGSTTQ
jgi:hypothetical protein